MKKVNCRGVTRCPLSIEEKYPEITGIIMKRLLEEGYLND